jgi:iron complex outermembrane receptor protein
MRRSTIATSIFLLAGTAFAADPMRAIAPKNLTEALTEFASQSGLQVVYRTELTERLRSQGAEAGLSAEEALRQLLRETGLRYEFVNDRTVAIRSEDSVPLGSQRADSGELRLAQSGEPRTAGSGASVQETESADALNAGIPEILVEGSRSVNADIVRTENDAQPYHIFDSSVIEQSGALNVEDFFKRGVPMNTTSLSYSQLASSFRGTQSSINLRGLGTNQTLVLINGRRTAGPGIFGGPLQPDLNSIPPGAIERIEVLPSSSAAIYGGSAVGGVVNVVLKRGFTGGDVRVGYENVTDGDSAIRSVSGSYGLSLEEGRTHVSLSALYTDGDPLLNGERPEILARNISRILQNDSSFLYTLSRPFYGSTPNISSQTGANLTLRDGTPLGSPITSVPFGFDASSDPAGFIANAGRYNTELPNSSLFNTGLQRPIGTIPRIGTVMASLQRDMSDRLSVFADFYHGSNVALTRNFNDDNDVLRVPSTSPINPFGQDVFVTLANPSSAPYRAESTSNRFTGGFTLKLPRSWVMATDYTHSENEIFYEGRTYTLVAANAGLANGDWNPFVDMLQSPSVDPLAPYRGSFGGSQGGTLNDLAVRLAGPLFALPGGRTTLTVGLEHRKEELQDGEFHFRFPNYLSESQNRKYLSQSQAIKSAYAEFRVPLIGEDNRLPGVQELELQAAVRSEHFSIDSRTAFQYVEGSGQSFIDQNQEIVNFTTKLESTNPTIGLRFKPFESLTLRGSYGTAFLPPTYGQLMPGNIALVRGSVAPTIDVVDRARGDVVTTVNYAFGGNPELNPQDSTNWNFGFIFEPQFAPGLRLNLEWYRIEQENVILDPDPQLIVDREAEFPGRVVRANPSAGDPYPVGPITLVDSSFINAARGKTSGFDLTIGYRWRTESLGEFDFSLAGTRIKTYQVQSGFDEAMTELVNKVAAGGPLQTRANAALTWDVKNWNLGWMMSYYGEHSQYDEFGETRYVSAQGSRSIPSQSYHNVSVGYEVPGEGGSAWAGNALSGVSVQLGIRNVFNKVPPFDAYYNSSYYHSPFGDARLRSYYLTLAKKF